MDNGTFADELGLDGALLSGPQGGDDGPCGGVGHLQIMAEAQGLSQVQEPTAHCGQGCEPCDQCHDWVSPHITQPAPAQASCSSRGPHGSWKAPLYRSDTHQVLPTGCPQLAYRR